MRIEELGIPKQPKIDIAQEIEDHITPLKDRNRKIKNGEIVQTPEDIKDGEIGLAEIHGYLYGTK